MKKILEISKALARQLQHNYVGTEHMLFALMRERECLANRILTELGMDFAKAEQAIMQIYQNGGSQQVKKRQHTQIG